MPRLIAQIISSRNCFVNLPQFMINEILRQQSKSWDGRILVKLQWVGNKDGVVLAWSGDRSQRPDRVEIGNDLASCLLLSSETDVDVAIVPSAAIHQAGRVLVEPTSADDWEILSLHAAFLEDQLINQVAVLHQDMSLPLWINTSTMIRIHVKETKPHHTVQLVAGSEVIVAPKPRAKGDESDESKAKTQSSKIKRKTKILRVQTLNDQGPVFAILCAPQDMQRLKWIDGLLVCVNALTSPSIAKPNQDDPAPTLRKAFARVISSSDVSAGHVVGHKHLLNDVLGVHQYSRIRIQPMASEDLAKSVSRIYLRPRKAETTNTSPTPKNEPALSELASSLSALISSEYASIGSRAIPMMNGSVVTICGADYALYFNLEFEEESPAPRQQPERPQDQDVSFSGIANALPALPGMPDMGAIDTIRDVYNRAMDARARAVPPKSVKPLSEQMNSKDLFFMDPKAIADVASSVGSSVKGSHVRFRVGEPLETGTGNPVAGSPAPVPEVRLEDIGGLDKEIKAAVQHITSILGYNRLREGLSPASAMFARGALFIHGQHGSGKSMLANAVATHFSSSKFKAHSLRLSCSELSGARNDAITKSIDQAFSEALLCQPSIVILDDLDVILPQEQQDVAQSWQLSVHLNIILDFLKAKIDQIQTQQHAVAIVCISQSASSVHEDLQHPHFFRTTISCPAPNRRSRGDILEKALAARGATVDSVDIPTIALRTEGYLGADLNQLVERAFYVASTRLIEASSTAAGLLSSAVTTPSSSPPSSPRGSRGSAPAAVSSSSSHSVHKGHMAPQITTKDLLKAQEDFVPASLKGVTLQKSDVSWDDIGGLNEVRDTLKQTLEWPTKYSFLFKSTPIRQRSGILLYGPSGCGKTLLASAVAKECGLNFISVKGPELLNKYIGASEQSVRDMFGRASAAAPCILFFDEFDAIAPRRGHDNTGVTDRVVNQFLTQLDGVEVLEGVYVLAATSRPDLIDPALLRPGRLDKCLFVGIPNRDERISILKCLSRKMALDKHVNWDELADATENYTGADLQALLYNAQLESIHSKLDNLRAKMLRVETEDDKGVMHAAFTQFKLSDATDLAESMSAEQRSNVIKKVETIRDNILKQIDESSTSAKRVEHNAPEITQDHLLKALSELVPSISPQERRRYQQIYGSFLQSRGADFQDSTTALQNQRQTLA